MNDSQLPQLTKKQQLLAVTSGLSEMTEGRQLQARRQ